MMLRENNPNRKKWKLAQAKEGRGRKRKEEEGNGRKRKEKEGRGKKRKEEEGNATAAT